MSPLLHPHTRHTSSLQLHPHTHHIINPGFVDGPRRSDCTAGQMDEEAGWWATSGKIGLPPLARVMGVGRQQQDWAYQHYNSSRILVRRHTFTQRVVDSWIPDNVVKAPSIQTHTQGAPSMVCPTWYTLTIHIQRP